MAQSRFALRRAFIRAREAVEDWVVAARSDLYAQRIVYLAKFSEPHEFERFQVTTDRVLGGGTDCSFTLKHYQHFSAGLFEGVIDYHDDNPMSRGGFASFRTKADEKERRLGSYEALEMRIKTDGRPYILNVKCADYSPEHLWQMRIVTPPAQWRTIALPFSEMMLTRRGRVEMEQREINRDCINGFGVLLADGRNGPFQFEIQYMRALAEFNPTEYTSAAEQMMGEQRRLSEPQRQLGGDSAAGNEVRLRPNDEWLRTPQARASSSRVMHVDPENAPDHSQEHFANAGEGPPQEGAVGEDGEEPAQPESLREKLKRLREAAKLK